MIEIDNTIVSLDIIEKKFACDIHKCKGICCIHGDSGAPLEDEEIQIINKNFSVIKPYLNKNSLEVINKKGIYYIDEEGDKVTTLINNKECVFTVFNNSIAGCAIEMAYLEKKINFRKPISCHLYPVRINKYKDFEAVNYEKNKICKQALEKGNKQGIFLYKYLKEPLVRKYGQKWYDKLEYFANILRDSKF